MTEAAPRLRLALLASDDAHHLYLAAELARRFDLAALVVEPGREQRRRLRKRGRWRDWRAALYHGLRRRLLGLDAYRRAYFALPAGAPAWPRPPDLVVDWINRPDVAALLEARRPDLTVVICTSILSRRTLAAAGKTVNIHGGFLPWYRGNHCFFFALYEEAFDRIGSSIHFVDAGVDTGDLIAHVVPPILEGDNAEKLYCRAEKAAIHRLVALLEALEAGEPLPRAPQLPGGRQYYTRDRKLHHDLRLWWRRRKRGSGRPVPVGSPAPADRQATAPSPNS
jgi:methionyl-tRNA formyltransferase